MRSIFSLLAVLTLGLSGCATAQRQAVSLTPPAVSYISPHSVSVNDVTVSVADTRADWSLDGILAKKGTDEVADVLRDAVTSANIAKITSESSVPLSIEVTLKKLEWFVPGYQAMLKKVFATSFLTGGLGGVAYGSTSTPVIGYATFHVRVRHGATELLDREYVGEHTESMAKLKCDSMQTKSRMVSVALGKAIDAMVQDLGKALSPQSPLAEKPARTSPENKG